MNVQELRSQFLGASSLFDRIRGLREQRVNIIQQNAGPATIQSKNKLALHIIPLGFLADEVLIDTQATYNLHEWFLPVSSRTRRYGGYSMSFNFDGVSVVAGTQKDGSVLAYTQIFRNGVVESVCGDMLYSLRDGDDPRFLKIDAIELTLATDLPPLCAGLAKLQVGPPVIVLITLIHVHGSKVRIGLESSPALTNHHLALPMVTFDALNLQGDWHHMIKQPLDVMWNAYDYAFSPNFKNGIWKAPQGWP